MIAEAALANNFPTPLVSPRNNCNTCHVNIPLVNQEQGLYNMFHCKKARFIHVSYVMASELSFPNDTQKLVMGDYVYTFNTMVSNIILFTMIFFNLRKPSLTVCHHNVHATQ